MSKTNKQLADEVIETFLEEFPYGYWEGVCTCCTGFDSTELALKEHLRKFFKKVLATANQSRYEELRELMINRKEQGIRCRDREWECDSWNAAIDNMLALLSTVFNIHTLKISTTTYSNIVPGKPELK